MAFQPITPRVQTSAPLRGATSTTLARQRQIQQRRRRRSTPPATASAPLRQVVRGAGGGEEQQGGWGGLLSDAWRMVHGLPQGLAGFGRDLLTDFSVPLHLGADLAVGGFEGDESIGTYLPATTGLAKSFQSTGARMIHPSRYVKAWNEGTLASSLVEDIGNLAIIGGPLATGLGAGAGAGTAAARTTGEAAAMGARTTLRSAGAQVAEDLGRGGLASRIRMSAPVAADVTELSRIRPAAAMVDVPTRYRGLAGVAERSGAPGAAEALRRTGNVVRLGSSLGEVTGNAPALPFQLPSRAVRRATGRGIGEWAAHGVSTAATKHPGLLFHLTEEGRVLAGIKGGVQRSATDASRDIAMVGQMAEELGLTEEQGRAILVDLEHPGFAETLTQLDDTELATALDRMYEGVDVAKRPTVAGVRELDAYRNGRLDAETKQNMDAVRQAIEVRAGQRTERGLVDEEAPLNPEQTGTGMLSFVVNRFRRNIEHGRNIAQRQWESAENKALRDERILSANEAVMTELPAPPSATGNYDTGVVVGKEIARDQAARRLHAQKLRDIDKAVDTYVRLVEGDDTAAVKRAETNLDRLIEEADNLRGAVEQAARRRDATAALSGVEVTEVPGGPRPMPEVAVTGERAAVRQIKDTAQEIADEQAYEVYGEIDNMTGATRPSMPNKKLMRDTGGEYEWWYELPEWQRQYLRNEGFMTGRTKTRRVRRTDPTTGKVRFVKETTSEKPIIVSPDDLARRMNERLGTDMDVHQAMAMYVEAVMRFREASSTKGASVIDLTAQRLGVGRDQVKTAVTGKISEYGPLLTENAETALNDLRNTFRSLSDEERTSFTDTLDSMIADPDSVPGDFTDLVETFFGPEVMSQEGPLAAIDNITDMREVVDWMRSGDELPPTLAIKLGVRGPAQQQAVGAAGARVTAARAAEVANFGEQRAGRVSLSAAQREAERAVNRAERDLEVTTTAEAAARPVEGPRRAEVMRPEGPDPWKRHTGTTSTGETTNPLSPAERARVQQGVLRERAAHARADANRKRRALDKATERVADVNNELSRKFQDRMHEDVNRPAVSSMHSIVSKAGAKLGTLVGEDDSLALTGHAARVSAKYGFYGDLLYVLDGMRSDMEQARRLAAVSEEGAVPMPALTARDIGDAIYGVMQQKRVTLSDVDAQQLVDSIGATSLAEDIAVTMADEVAAGRRLNSPMRVKDIIDDHPWNMPADARSRLEARWQAFQNKRAATIRKIYNDQTAAMPARYRTIAMANQRQIGALIEMAEDKNKQAPGAGDVYLDLAEETMNTLGEMVDAGIDPVHLIGGKAARSTSPTSVAGGRLTRPRLRAETVRRAGLRQLSLDAYLRVEAEQAHKWIKGRMAAEVDKRLGLRADELPEVRQSMRDWADAHGGEVQPGIDVAKAAADAGYVPVAGDTVGPQTRLVPKAVKDAMNEADINIPGWKALTRGNQMWKNWVLPFSPKWMTGNVFGNIIQAAAYAGVGPVELARQMVRISKHEGGWRALWERSGLPDWTPNEIANHGLTHEEYRVLMDTDANEARTRVGQGIQKASSWSYKLNEFVDNTTRSAVYLSKLSDGVPREAALQSTLKALGDYTRMSSFERRFVRQVIPFYTWIRHSTVATLRLPINSPSRAAFMLHLADLYDDPEMSNELLAFLGSRIPLGGGSYFNIGSVSPLAEVSGNVNPFDISSYGRAVSPLLKVPAALATGLDINDWDQLSRPAGTMNRGPYGQEQRTPPLGRLFSDPLRALGEVGYVATQQMPGPIKGLRDVLLGNEVRYQTGYQVGDLTKDEGLLSRVARAGNIPWVERPDLAEMEKRRQRNIERQRG